ncbi:MAG: radical SAM protein [bacterium]
MTGTVTNASPDPGGLASQRLGEIYVLLHMDCELKCKVCPYWGLRGACRDPGFRAAHLRPLELGALKTFIDQTAAYRPRTLTLSGGEPLLSPDWVEVAAHAKSRGLRVALSTNALHIPRYYDEVFQLVDSIHVSLGGTQEILGQIRGAEYGFDEVLDCLAEISARKRAQRRHRPTVRIIYVVSDLSYRQLEEFYELFQTRGIGIDSFYFQHVIYVDPDSLRRQKQVLAERGLQSQLWDSYLYTPGAMDFDVLRRQIDALSGRDGVRFSPRLSPSELPLYYDPSTKGRLAARGRCRAPWTQVDLYPNGDIQVCPDYVLGNIYRQPFVDIWNGDRAQHLRRHLLTHHAFPACSGCFYYYVSHEDPTEEPNP